jgi:hypothetical protein
MMIFNKNKLLLPLFLIALVLFIFAAPNISNNKEHYLSICVIMKNETEYIEEWIEYHKLVGVEKFYIFDNESEDNLKEILQPYIKQGIVDYISYPGIGRQSEMYRDCIIKYKNKTRWIAFIDADEFIVPVKKKTLPEFLKDFEEYDGIEVNWLIYGSNGHKTKTDGLVMERFKTHAPFDFSVNKHVKSIVNPKKVKSTVIAHYFFYLENKVVDSNYNIIPYRTIPDEYLQKKLKLYSDDYCKKSLDTMFNKTAYFDKIRINHYVTKSFEEIKKRKEGKYRADSLNKYNDDIIDYFKEHDKNEIYDDIMDKYIPIIKEKLNNK